jgi:hypothetical protein
MAGVSTVAQTTSALAYDKALDTPGRNAFAWRRRSGCLTVVRVNGGLRGIQAFRRTGA